MKSTTLIKDGAKCPEVNERDRNSENPNMLRLPEYQKERAQNGSYNVYITLI